MIFWKMIFGILLRKFIGPPLVVLSLLAGFVAFQQAPLAYSMTLSLVLMPPSTGESISLDPKVRPTLTNPLLQNNDGLKTTTGMMILSMNSEDARKGVGVTEEGPIELIVDDGRSNAEVFGIVSSSPYINVEANSPSEAQTKTTVDKVRTRLAQALLTYQRQLDAPKSTYITMHAIAEIGPKPVYSLKIQYALIAAVASFLLLFGLIYLFFARKLRRTQPQPPAPLPMTTWETEVSVTHEPITTGRPSAPALPAPDRTLPVPVASSRPPSSRPVGTTRPKASETQPVPKIGGGKPLPKPAARPEPRLGRQVAGTSANGKSDETRPLPKPSSPAARPSIPKPSPQQPVKGTPAKPDSPAKPISTWPTPPKLPASSVPTPPKGTDDEEEEVYVWVVDDAIAAANQKSSSNGASAGSSRSSSDD